MANEINNLDPVLLAIGRQIAERRGSPCRAPHPERDLPILLLPHAAPSQVASDRMRAERQLPLLMGDAPAEPAEPEGPVAPSRPQRKEGPYPRLDPDLLGGTPA
jgi:hypothetical protein